jgi:hypothetical protein
VNSLIRVSIQNVASKILALGIGDERLLTSFNRDAPVAVDYRRCETLRRRVRAATNPFRAAWFWRFSDAYVLNALPLLRNAAQDSPYYSWNGQTLRRAVVGIAERTLGAVFKIGWEECPCAPVPPYARNAITWRRGKFPDRGRHRGEHGGDRSEGLREVVQGPAGEHRSAHVGTLPHSIGYNSSHKNVTRKNGGRKLMTPKELFWCGEGDLNPHEIAPASTSS